MRLITPVIVVPYVSRVLTVDGIGIQSYTNSIISYFVLFGILGSQLYGQREIAANRDNPQEKIRIAVELVCLRVMTCLLSFGIFASIVLPRMPEYKVYLLAESIIFLTTALDVAWYFKGEENFKFISLRSIFFQLVSIASVFLLVKSKGDLVIFILILTCSNLCSALCLWPYFCRDMKKCGLLWYTIRPFRHLKSTFLLFIPSLASQFYLYTDRFLIGYITDSPYENGCYESAVKIIRLLILFVVSLVPVFAPRIANLKASNDMGKISEIMERSFRFMFLLALPMIGGMLLMAPRIVPVFFGAGYEKTVILLQILSFLFLAIGLNNTIGIQFLIPMKKEKLFTAAVTTGAIVNLPLNFLLIPRIQSAGAACASVATELIIATVMYIGYPKVISFSRMVKTAGKPAFGTVVMCSIMFLLSCFLQQNLFALLLICVCGIIIYGLTLLFLKEKFVLEGIQTMYKKFKMI